MRFRRKKPSLPALDPDNDPIYISHEQDPSLDEDELVMHTMIDPDSINKENE